MSCVYGVYSIIVFSCVMFATQYVYLSILQFNGYSYCKFLKARFDTFKSNLLVYILFVILFIFAIVLSNYFNGLYAIFYIILQGIFLLIYYVRQFEFCELVFTKRIIRYGITLILLDFLLLLLLVCWVPLNVFNIITCLLILLSFMIFSISYLVLMPIEKLIGKKYINLAKSVLSNNKGMIKIGITGSYAKTSVKEILNAILKESYNVVATPKSYNTPYGVTKTINNYLTNSSEVFVCEMGAKKKGEILELCNIVNIDRGIVTSVGHQHTDTFGGVEGVYSTKKELADFLRNKMCVFNLMNEFTRKMYFNYVGRGVGCFIISKSFLTKNIRVVKRVVKTIIYKGGYALNCLYVLPHKNNYYAKVNKLTEFGSVFDVYYNYQKLGTVTTLLLGKHNVINSIMAIAMAIDMGVSFIKIQKALVTLKSINARLEKFVTSKGAVVINNGYNSNINSARSSLGVLNLFGDRTKVVITPGLIETSDDFAYNRMLGEMLGGIADEIIIVKEKNKDAILMGLSSVCFDMTKVYFVNSFFDAKGVIDMASDKYVFLIENDLPNYYK